MSDGRWENYFATRMSRVIIFPTERVYFSLTVFGVWTLFLPEERKRYTIKSCGIRPGKTRCTDFLLDEDTHLNN